MLEGYLLKVWEQCQYVLFVWDEIRVLRVPLAFDLAYHQRGILEYTQELDPQVNSSSKTHKRAVNGV